MPQQPLTTTDGVQLDPKVLKVMRAIRQVESGGSYNAVGDAGDAHGAFQYNEKTGPGWKNLSRQFLGDENAPMDKANQNKVTYMRIKQWKDEGKDPEEIAALWNGASKDPTTGKYIYNNPDYGNKFRTALSGGGMGIPTAQASTIPGVQPPPPPPEETVTAPTEPTEAQDNLLVSGIKDIVKTSFIEPADRLAELVGRTGILGKDIKKGYELMSDEGQSRNFGGIEVEPQKAFGQGGAKQIAGSALKSFSNLYGLKGAGGVVQSGLKGKILQGLVQGAKVGAIGGGAYGVGNELQQEGSDATSIATQGAIGAGLGLATGGVLGGASGALAPVLNRQGFVQDLIKGDVEKLLGNGRAMQNATQLAKQKNVPIEDILSDPEVFKGLQVRDGNIEPDDALAVLDDKIEDLMNAKARLLPEVDRLVVPVPRETLRKLAYQNLEGKMTKADRLSEMRSIDEQINAESDLLNASTLDEIRALARQSSRNAKGLQKSQSAYTAIENAARDLEFKMSDKLPVDPNGEFATLNNEIKNLIGGREFIDKTLRGRKAPGAGWAREALARLVGGMAGGVTGTGPLGVILGAEAGRAISSIIGNKSLGSSIKMKLIKGLTKDSKVLQAAEELITKAKGYDPVKERLALPAPKQIEVGPRGSTRPQEPLQVEPAPKGKPGIVPTGKEGGGRLFKTFSSASKGLIDELKNNNKGFVNFGAPLRKVNLSPEKALKKLTLPEISVIKQYLNKPTEGSIQGKLADILEKLGIDKTDFKTQDRFLKDVAEEYDDTFKEGVKGKVERKK